MSVLNRYFKCRSLQFCGSASLWCGPGSGSWLSLRCGSGSGSWLLKRLKALKKCSNRLIFRTFWLVIWKLMRIRIQLTHHFDADPDPAGILPGSYHSFDADPDGSAITGSLCTVCITHLNLWWFFSGQETPWRWNVWISQVTWRRFGEWKISENAHLPKESRTTAVLVTQALLNNLQSTLIQREEIREKQHRSQSQTCRTGCCPEWS